MLVGQDIAVGRDDEARSEALLAPLGTWPVAEQVTEELLEKGMNPVGGHPRRPDVDHRRGHLVGNLDKGTLRRHQFLGRLLNRRARLLVAYGNRNGGLLFILAAAAENSGANDGEANAKKAAITEFFPNQHDSDSIDWGSRQGAREGKLVPTGKD